MPRRLACSNPSRRTAKASSDSPAGQLRCGTPHAPCRDCADLLRSKPSWLHPARMSRCLTHPAFGQLALIASSTSPRAAFFGCWLIPNRRRDLPSNVQPVRGCRYSHSGLRIGDLVCGTGSAPSCIGTRLCCGILSFDRLARPGGFTCAAKQAPWQPQPLQPGLTQGRLLEHVSEVKGVTLG